jgi:CubicO group peptidase (beta-lactamase class C family)
MKKLFFILLTPLGVISQNLPDSIVSKIDSVFKSYTPATPGCAVAIVKNGTVVFQKGYGMANLEYSIPVQPTTTFHIASESKQYVAFCMLLLEKEGKLSLDDDIRKYLDDVPDFGHKITIRHLIYHTSGLRDQWQLLANAGWQLDDVITQEHVTKLVSKQKALNFIPGDEWMYCNTGYTLMAEIVKKVSGLTLRQYAEKNIFQPLGMNHTHFHDNYQELVPGRAYSYNQNVFKKFQHAVLSYSIVGATSLLTTVLDEVKWLNNFETGTVGGKDLIEKMYEVGMLNNGKKLTYAFGLSIGKYKGWKQIGHGGADAGFRSYACRFPEQNLGVVVFSNHGSVNPTSLTNEVANLLLPGGNEEKPEDKLPTPDSAVLKKFHGKYSSVRGNLADMFWKDGKLFGRNSNGSTFEINLSVLGNNRYRTGDGGVIIVDEKSQASDSIMAFTMESVNNTISFVRRPAIAQKITAEFAGKYFGSETESFYYITEKDGKLSLDHRKFATVRLTNIAPDQFTSPHWWMSHIRFLRDKQKKIIAFEVNSGRIQHLRYDRVN